jgi:4-amino-4-deoxy-L-arabinose transferase-like glycosyltransferase
MFSRTYLWIALVGILILGARLVGPSDIYDNSQPRTVAYTADMVRNGRWILPRDTLGRYATKPPMYNWIGAAVPAMFDIWDEWVLKLPAILAGCAILVVVLKATPSIAAGMVRQRRGGEEGALATTEGDDATLTRHITVLASLIWIANLSTMKLIYLARPDLLVTAFVVAAWALGTAVLRDGEKPGSDRGERIRLAACRIGFWLCVGAAVLTKGPPALLPLLYVVLASKLIHGKWSAVNRTQWWWGLPLALAMVAAWVLPVYLEAPDHFRNVLVGEEIVNRVSDGGVRGIVLDLWRMPAWFTSWFLPWSIPVIAMLIHIGPRRWLRHPIAPAVLWLLLVITFFSMSDGKRPDYLAPAYPAAAMIAACALLGLKRPTSDRAPSPPTKNGFPFTLPIGVAAVLVVTVILAVFELKFSNAARDGYGEAMIQFTREVRRITRGEPVTFAQTGVTSLQALLGKNDPMPVPNRGASVTWIVAPADQRSGAWVVTEKALPLRTGAPVTLGLFSIATDDAGQAFPGSGVDQAP